MGRSRTEGWARVVVAPSVRDAVTRSRVVHALVHRTSVTSTQDAVRSLLPAGVGTLVVADAQTRGRGRHGRTWLDGPTPASSLAASIGIDARTLGRDLALLPLAIGLAVAEAADAVLRGALGARDAPEVALKWPNDVLVMAEASGTTPTSVGEGSGSSWADGARKCAGVLVERHEIEGTVFAVVGMGIDVDWRGSATDRPWTSLAEAIDDDVSADVLLAALVVALGGSIDALVRDEATLLSAYRRRCATIGRPVAIERPGGVRLEGVAVAVDDAGRLVVEADGVATSLDAGDVAHLRTVPSDPGTR